MMSYWKSFVCNKHVTKSILCDKTLDNQLSLADKSFIKLGLFKKFMIFMQLMFSISGYLCIILTVIGHLWFVYENWCYQWMPPLYRMPRFERIKCYFYHDCCSQIFFLGHVFKRFFSIIFILNIIILSILLLRYKHILRVFFLCLILNQPLYYHLIELTFFYLWNFNQ